jgi:hypothetical protein
MRPKMDCPLGNAVAKRNSADTSRSINLSRKLKTAAYNPDYIASALQLRKI